jgi:hypothetical protein
MTRISFLALLIILFFPLSVIAGSDPVKSAESAGPPDLSSKATIKNWDGKVLRQGSNGWTCLPDMPGSPQTDPWCVDKTWEAFLDAYLNKRKPSYDQVGVAYMLMGDAEVSNSDPYASKKTTDADWVTGLGAHLMVLVPNVKSISNFPSEWRKGGPWIMWGGTPYEHLMIPLDSMKK